MVILDRPELRSQLQLKRVSKTDCKAQIKEMSKEIINVNHQLNRLVSTGMSHFTNIHVNNGDGSCNKVFLCGGYTHLALSVPIEQKGPLLFKFDKVYDVRVFVSETNKDPNENNCSYMLPSGKKVLAMDPKDQKINLNKKHSAPPRSTCSISRWSPTRTSGTKKSTSKSSFPSQSSSNRQGLKSWPCALPTSPSETPRLTLSSG